MQTRTLILLLLLCSGKLFAQTAEKFTQTLKQTKNGVKVTFMSKKHSITMDIVSKNIKPTSDPSVITVDNKAFQYVLIPNSSLSITDTTLARQKAELLGYVDYELDYVKNEVKMKITGVTERWVTINNKLFLFWTYNMPPSKEKSAASEQLNLSTLCYAHALNLNSAVTNGENWETNGDLLMRAAKTLRFVTLK